MALLTASASSQLTTVMIVFVIGVVIAIAGHITRLSWLILLGILLVGGDVVLFWVVQRPGAA